eukprot:g11234.t1
MRVPVAGAGAAPTATVVRKYDVVPSSSSAAQESVLRQRESASQTLGPTPLPSPSVVNAASGKQELAKVRSAPADPYRFRHWDGVASRSLAAPDPAVYKLTGFEKFEQLPLAKLRNWHAAQIGQDYFLDEQVFRGMRNGFYVECGASDGFLHSNTLFFERVRQWGGVLVEASPTEFGQIVAAGLRKASKNSFFNGCLTDASHSGKQLQYVDRSEYTSGLGVVLTESGSEAGRASGPPGNSWQGGVGGGLAGGSRTDSRDRVVSVPCVSLTELLTEARETFPKRFGLLGVDQVSEPGPGRGGKLHNQEHSGPTGFSVHRVDGRGKTTSGAVGSRATAHNDVHVHDAPILVDLFSLDVEGNELEVLRGIDFVKLHIHAFLIEYAPPPHATENLTGSARLKRLADFFAALLGPAGGGVGYELVALLGPIGQCGERGVYFPEKYDSYGRRQSRFASIGYGSKHIKQAMAEQCQDVVFRRTAASGASNQEGHGEGSGWGDTFSWFASLQKR